MFNGKKNELVTTEAGKGKMLTMPFFFFFPAHSLENIPSAKSLHEYARGDTAVT